jgi:GGDEF domain-containing protein
LLDIDNFRSINQCFGASVADSLIKEVAKTLVGLKAGTCYRVDADVFALVVVRDSSEPDLSDALICRWLHKLSGCTN